MTKPIWKPRYALVPGILNSLMQIEAARAIVERIPLSLSAQAKLRHRARMRSTHFSTRIEGNRLTLAETEQVIEAAQDFKGRERDVREVQHYWQALLWVEAQAARKAPLTEAFIKTLHAKVEHGARAAPTPYRDGQNVIRDSITRDIVYLPPEAKDVPALMSGLTQWVALAERERLPVPIIAGLAHYQLVTIHPYFDGNGRTARLLATFLLVRGGYGLNGYISIEEHHARDLDRYYAALVTHPHHNYYEGRAEAEVTDWLAYYLQTLNTGFQLARDGAMHAASATITSLTRSIQPASTDPRFRLVLGLFDRQLIITSADVAASLGLSTRMARVLLANWVADGLLVIVEPSRKRRAYARSPEPNPR